MAKQAGLSTEQREEINAALFAYGARLTEDDHIEKGGKAMSVRLMAKGGRLRVEGGGALLASYPASRIGSGVSDFVEKFWFWKKGKTADPAGGSFIAYPRSGLESFPPIYSPTIAGAVSAGLATGLPFDVHTPGGAVAWGWEQRSDEDVARVAKSKAQIKREVDDIVADLRLSRR